MKDILISSFDMEVGGVERSLISMLDNFDFDNYNVDLMLYSHKGDFMNLLNDKVNLLNEDDNYSTFRQSIKDIFKSKKFNIAVARLKAKIHSSIKIKKENICGDVVYQNQLMWKYALPYLPKIEKEYDVAISYLWPHYFIAEKVKAKKKIAWIHTDYSTIKTDIKIDLEMWKKFNYIVSISEECTKTFLKKYPELKDKIILMENITSPNFVKKMSNKEIELNISNDKSFKIVTVGRLCYQKAIDNAIKALKILHNRGFDDIKWYVIGYGKDEYMLKELIKENNLEKNFILLGKKINPYPYMKMCNLYVQPSRYEGKAVTVNEAKILGKPVIITNYPTAKSQIINGFDGYICKSTVEDIANSIEHLYKNINEMKKLSLNNLNTDYGNYNELKKLYEKIEE